MLVDKTNEHGKDLCLLTSKQLADRLGCTEKMISNSRINGKGPPYVRISRRMVRYRPEDVEAWIAGKVKRFTAEA